MSATQDLFPDVKPDALVLQVHGQAMTTSRRVAAMFCKEHKNVLRAIDRLLPDLPGDFSRLNFEPRTYLDDRGKAQPECLLSQDGFLMLAMGFTGREAARWRAAFIKAFNDMAKALARQQRALFSAGLLDQVESAITSLPPGARELALIDWRTAREVRKDDQWVQALAPVLGLNPAGLTALFNAAAQIT